MAKKTTTTKKRVVKVEAYGEAHISSTFNNVIVTLTNGRGPADHLALTVGEGHDDVVEGR